MEKYINKSALVDWIKKQIDSLERNSGCSGIFGDYQMAVYDKLFSFINTLEVKTPYEQCVQYDSIKAGIQAHAETYSFNIESELFNQLTKEQQELWRKEIEQACISGGEVGVELARDPRYKENLEVKEINNVWNKASDFPKAEAGRSILLIEDNGHAELLKSPSAERLFYFRPVNLKMWAYVDELLY